MKNCFWLSLAFVVVLAYSANQLHAKGGGHGGGHHGGGHHGGHHGSHHHSGHHDHHHDHHHAHHHHNGHHYAGWNGNHHPFSAGWYGNHTGGWYGGNGANWWAPATFGAAAGWMGMSANNPVAYSYPSAPTYVTSDNGSGQPQQTNPATRATQLAQTGAADPNSKSQFLPLGVFTLAAENEKDADAMLQLAVNKEGVLRGTYYDLENDKEEPIHGAIDKQTQQVAWTVGTDKENVYETALASLTGESGPLAMHGEDGELERLTMARMSEPPADAKPAAETATEKS